MDFKVSSLVNAINPNLRLVDDFFDQAIDDHLFSKGFLNAKVIERLLGNEYLLSFSGKQFKLSSGVKLFSGENLVLKINKENSQVQLEILSRGLSSEKSEFGVGSVWTKSYFSPLKTLYSAMESTQSDVSFQKLYQFLDVFFPGINWDASVSQFTWKFQEGEANGFFGKKKDYFGFYFHYESIHIGNVDSYLNWKKDDFSDAILHCVFDKLTSYQSANEKLIELKKMLSTNLISVNEIIFHYSSVHREKGDWTA